MRFTHDGSIDDTSVLFQIMYLRRPGDQPLPELLTTKFYEVKMKLKMSINSSQLEERVVTKVHKPLILSLSQFS